MTRYCSRVKAISSPRTKWPSMKLMAIMTAKGTIKKAMNRPSPGRSSRRLRMLLPCVRAERAAAVETRSMATLLEGEDGAIS